MLFFRNHQVWIGTFVVFMLGSGAALAGVGTSGRSKGKSVEARTRALTVPQLVSRKLRSKGAKKSFIQQVEKATDWSIQDQVVELNIFGFLKRADYSAHLSPTAVEKGLRFLRENAKVLRLAERRYGVPKEVITSLLWVETRHGSNVGTFQVASVYAVLAGADHPDVVDRMLAKLEAEVPKTDPKYKGYEQKVRERTRSKAEWALEELRTLEKLHSRKKLDAFKLTGSFAGAFGVPQFIPSSYMKWSRRAKSNRTADLFKVDDAILSVANYLKSHGWRKSKQSHRKALYGYNRSNDYVETILQLAEMLKKGSYQQRTLAKDAER